MRARVCDYDGRSKGVEITFGEKINEGGEGKIYEIVGNKNSVAKVYLKGRGRREKIEAMLKNVPEDPSHSSHISYAWPENLLLDEKDDFIGFTMPYLKDFFHIHQIWSTDERREILKNFGGGALNWRFLFVTALNFASVVASIHEKGHLIGDINESNVLIFPLANVTLIDCDSFFIADGDKVYKSNVGVGKYTAPEISDFENRTEESDRFGVAILIFRLLMSGFHPFWGKWNGKGDSPTSEENIKAGRIPYFKSSREFEIAPNSPPIDILPAELKRLFERAFVKGHGSPDKRPTAVEWFESLNFLKGGLENKCVNPNHFCLAHLDKCPWCEHAKRIRKDPFPTSSDKPKRIKKGADEIKQLLGELK